MKHEHDSQRSSQTLLGCIAHDDSLSVMENESILCYTWEDEVLREYKILFWALRNINSVLALLN